MNKPIKGNSCFFLSELLKRILLLLFIFGYSSVFSNELDSLYKKGYGIIETKVFSTKDNTLEPAKLLEPEYLSKFIQLPDKKLISPSKIYWYLLDFSESELPEAEKRIIRFPQYNNITLYYQNDGIIESVSTGRMERRKSDCPYYADDFVIFESQLIEGRYLLAKIQHVFRRTGFKPAICMDPLVAEIDREYFTKNDILSYIPYMLFIGGMLLMIFYSFGIYFMYRDKLFNYYAIYLLTLLLYLGMRFPLIFNPLEFRYPVIMHAHNELIQVLVNIFYLVFAAIFLNARYDFPKLYRAIKITIWFLSGIMILQLSLVLSVRYVWAEYYVIQFERYFMIIFSLTAYVHILLNYKNKNVFFIITGSLFFLAGGFMAMLFHHIKYMMLGAAIEVFIFSLGMGYRIMVVEQNKQLVEKEMNKLLLTALRAQMNPHFIFNSLNSIRAYVISSEINKASDYLNKFTRLIRLVLHYSSKETISLKEELDTLTLYIELEQMRFRDNFGFALEIDPDVDIHSRQVPPLILQPYVENAIVHGLTPKSGIKELLVKVSKSNSNLCLIVRDNGVGRGYSKDTQTIKSYQHKSIAMELTRKRIELSNIKQQGDDNIKITDLLKNGQPSGTEVRIKLPAYITE